MRAYIESILDCPAESAWAEVTTPRLLEEVMWPLLRLVPRSGSQFPARWQGGQTVVGQAYAMSILPLGLHRLRFEWVDPQRRQIQTRETNRWVRVWDHLISVREAPGGRTRYSDEIEIHAGPLTPLVWLFANCFYRHRQRRWRRVARRLAKGV